MLPLSICILVFCFSLILLIKRRGRKGQKNIPGPVGLPLLGNILQFIGVLPHKRLGQWAEKYGEIFQIKLGPKVNLIISDPHLLKQEFNGPNFGGRPVFDFAQIYEGERLGIVVNDGPFWETHRRFALKQLKDLGAFPRAMESSIFSQVDKVIQIFNEIGEESLSSHKIKNIMSNATVESVWVILCSGHDGSEAVHVIEKLFDSLNGIVKGGFLAIACPWLRPICPKLIGYEAYRKAMDQFQNFFQTVIQKRKESFDENNIRDFIDAFLAEMKKAEQGTPFYGDLAEKQLGQFLFEMYCAAGDTIAGTLEWAIFYLCKNPKVQEKLIEEIGRVTGNTRNVVLADKSKMHFTLSVIEEVLRYSSLAAFGFFRRSLQDQTVCGYFIPKNTWILPNLHYIHHNPKIWGDPENFRPERFIEDGNFKRNENVLAFGTGKRQCVGENIGRDSLFLYLTNIFQKFTVEFDPYKEEPGMEPKLSFGLEPYPFSIVMKRRNIEFNSD